MHRFAWDLHYPPPPAEVPDGEEKEGIWTPPGHYTIELGNAATVANEPTEILAVPLLRRLLPPALPRAAAQ